MQLNEEHILIQDTARKFAANRLAPNAEEWVWPHLWQQPLPVSINVIWAKQCEMSSAALMLKRLALDIACCKVP